MQLLVLHILLRLYISPGAIKDKLKDNRDKIGKRNLNKRKY